MRVLGLISGTSHDGIDAAVVDFTLDGDTLQAVVRHASTTPYGPGLRQRLLDAAGGVAGPADICALDTLIGQAFADVAAQHQVDLICSHGQTLYHWIDGATARGTLQIGQPAWIAERTGTPVVADLRARDLAAGGQGAPLVALADMLLLGNESGSAALNLGGIANLTVMGDPPIAFDTGPGNALIDAAARRLTGGRLHFDVDGRLAAAGRVDEALLAHLLTEPYYALPPPKTTGKELFGESYAPDADITTLTVLTAETIAAQVKAHAVKRVIASGGGCANPVLMAMLRERLPGVAVEVFEHSDAKEAIAFASLGWLTWHGLPGNLPSGTGARGPRVLGAIIPGAGPLRLPAPLARAPRRMVLQHAGHVAHGADGAADSAGDL